MASLSRQGVDLEMHMNGVERALEYHAPRLPAEAPTSMPDDAKLGAEFPRTGRVELRHVTMRYRAELDPVLIDVSLKIKDKEKVASKKLIFVGVANLLCGC
jgi:ABC-type multidrug transport system fused ATPase/permease subunit